MTEPLSEEAEWTRGEPEFEEEEFKPATFPFVWADDITENADDAPEIVEDILTAGAMSVWYGESNSGKTYLILDLARAIARGHEWLGKRTMQGCVIYVAAEGSKTIERRLRAIRMETGDAHMPIGVVKTSVDLCDPDADTAKLITLILDKSKEIGAPPLLVVIDTLSRVLAGGNENDSVDLGKLVKNGDRIREETKAHIGWVHHAGKDTTKGARGHSLLRAATDTELEILHDENSGIRTIKVRKQRDLGSNGMELHAKLWPLEMGTNQWGKPITACVVKPIIESEIPRQNVKKKLSESSNRALAAVRKLCEGGNLSAETSVIPRGKRMANIDLWRESFRTTCGDLKDSAFRVAWHRVQKDLLEERYIGIHEKIVWLW